MKLLFFRLLFFVVLVALSPVIVVGILALLICYWLFQVAFGVKLPKNRVVSAEACKAEIPSHVNCRCKPKGFSGDYTQGGQAPDGFRQGTHMNSPKR